MNKLSDNDKPILYSFRRCPYAIRSRMCLYKAGITVELREIELKNKPEQMLQASPKGTVPILILRDGTIIDESLDIMKWALDRNDPDCWLNGNEAEIKFLTDRNDNEFKQALDHYKYPNRYPNDDCKEARKVCARILSDLNDRLELNHQIIGKNITIADIALFPFVRQCAFVDKEWFNEFPVPYLKKWLQGHLDSTTFKAIMIRSKIWSLENHPIMLKSL